MSEGLTESFIFQNYSVSLTSIHGHPDTRIKGFPGNAPQQPVQTLVVCHGSLGQVDLTTNTTKQNSLR